MGVLVVDPHPALRASLRAALELEDGVRVAGEAGDLLAGLRVAAHARITRWRSSIAGWPSCCSPLMR
jgi:DNA-binding NarL/FixJ family response regulator